MHEIITCKLWTKSLLFSTILSFGNLYGVELSFGVPERLDQPVSSRGADFGSGISPDGNTLFFNYCVSFQSDCDIYTSVRDNPTSDFAAARPLPGPVNTGANELYPSVSPNGLQLYFADAISSPFDNFKRRSGGQGGGDIWMATRAAPNLEFSEVVNLGPHINSRSLEAYPHVSADGMTLLFSSNRRGGSGGADIYMATRDSFDEPFDNVTNLGPQVNSSSNDGRATISSDGLVLFFDSDRTGGFGNYDIWMATREDTSLPFGNVQNLGSGVNTPTLDSGPSLSADGSRLFFESFRSPNLGVGADLWAISVSGIVLEYAGDIDGDGDCDVADIDALAVAIRGGQIDSRYDLDADGVVDSRDHLHLVTAIKQTWLGDSNLDGLFDTLDFITVFQAGEYEDGIPLNSNWSDGDWNGDGEFDTGDFIAAFNDGGYEAGIRRENVIVPEPFGIQLLLIGSSVVWRNRRQRNRAERAGT